MTVPERSWTFYDRFWIFLVINVHKRSKTLMERSGTLMVRSGTFMLHVHALKRIVENVYASERLCLIFAWGKKSTFSNLSFHGILIKIELCLASGICIFAKISTGKVSLGLSYRDSFVFEERLCLFFAWGKKPIVSNRLLMLIFWKPISSLVIWQIFRIFGHSLTDWQGLEDRIWG